MKAMLLDAPGTRLRLAEVPMPVCGDHEVLLKVHACGVCRTDLHVVDGELIPPKLPLIPGHEIVGEVVALGKSARRFSLGQRLGVPWLGRTCGVCCYCKSHQENLCDRAQFTGYTLNGGFAEYATAHQDYCFAMPESYSDAEAAPLLCAGLIGCRALVAAGDARLVCIYGFGAAAHILIQVASWQGRRVFAFTKPGDLEGQAFAMNMGAEWAGDSTQPPPQAMDAAILFAPVGSLVPQALCHIVKGGTVICAGIHMSDIPAFPYKILWGERTVRSVANLTRHDGERFFALVPQVKVKTTVEIYPLEAANEALANLRQGSVHGAAVLVMQ